MKKYNNIPSYVKNVKRSGRNIVSNQLRHFMPTLSNTMVNSRDVFKEFSSFDRSNYIRYGNYVKQRKNIIFGPLKDFIRNAKDDLKSGKYYNEERIYQASGNGIDNMLDGFGDIDEMMDDSEFENVRITSKFDKYLKSTSSSLSVGNRALSNSLNEVSINNTEYIANVNTMNNTKFMALTTKHHMEQMKQLKNIENIGMSILKFNEEIVAGAIERQDKFHEDILNETRELKELIQQQTDFNMSRFKTSTKFSNTYSPLERILGSAGSIDMNEYVKNIKKNIKRQSPMDMDMVKTFFDNYSASPISSMLNFVTSLLIPNDIKKGMKNLDKGISSLFATYLLQLNNLRYNGKNSITRKLAEILGVNINTYSKPNLSIYRNQDMSIEIEQKKAKAITEVIPTYLSKITEAMTGITKSYDYNRGVFVDKTKKRKEIINDYKNNIYNDMYDSGQSLEKQYNLQKSSLSRSQTKYMEQDIREFITFIGMHTIQYSPNMTYSQLRKKGLRLKGGESSYNLIRRFYMSMSKAEQMNIRTEQLQSLSRRPGLNNRFDIELQNSGDSALFNGMDEFDEDGNLIIMSYAKGGTNSNSKSKYNLRRNIKGKKRNKNEREESWWHNKSDEYNSKINTGVVKILNKLGIKTSPIVSLLTGITDGIYGLSTGTGKPSDKATDFMTTILNSIKNSIFGEYDDNGSIKKEGILPKKIGDQIKKYLPKSSTGATIGGLVGLTMKHPILGAIAGGALNVLIETDKIKKFLWGDPDKDDKGLFGGLKDKLDEKIINPLRNFLKEKFKDKMGNVKDKFDTFFDTYDTMNGTETKKRYKIVSGTITDILKSFTKSKSSGGANSNILNKITGGFERGIYSSQLDTIIALLSGGFGYIDGNGRITPPNNTNSGNTGSSGTITLTEKDYKVIGKNLIDSATGRNNSANLTTSESLQAGTTGEKKSKKYRLLNNSKYVSSDPIQIQRNIEILENEQILDMPLTDNEIYERAIIDELKKNPSFAKQVKDIADKMFPHFKNKVEFIRKNIENKNNSSDNTILGSALGKIKSKNGEIDFDSIKSNLYNRLSLRGIGRGRGGLIGFALGSMLLGNPLLGALVGMTFTGEGPDTSKPFRYRFLDGIKKTGKNIFEGAKHPIQTINSGKDSIKKGAGIVGRSAKYALLTTLLGLGPMPGVLIGSLLPEKKKKDPNEEPSKFEKMFGGSSKKGKFIGGLAGFAVGGVPGMLIGGALGGKLIGKNKINKNDWDVRFQKFINPDTGQLEIRERPLDEQRAYIKRMKDEEKERKRQKVAKGTIMDMITGGGKAKGGLVGGLAGLMVGGVPGLLLGGLGGTVLGTRRGNLNRDKTAGILSKQGRWRASLIGALIGNAFMGPVVGPLVGGLMGSMLSKGTDRNFWRYDENGNVLERAQQRLRKKAFKKEYKYKRNTEAYNYDNWLYDRAAYNGQENIGPAPDINDSRYDTNEKRGFWEARRKRREIMDRENAIRDENAKKFNKNTDKKFNMDNLAVFNQSKATGAYKGAVMATQFLGPYATVAGAALGAIVSKKKTPPDGSQKRPFYVIDSFKVDKNKNYENKLETHIKDIVRADNKGGNKTAELKHKSNSLKLLNSGNLSINQKEQILEQTSALTTSLKDSGSGFTSQQSGDGKSSGLLDWILPFLLGGGASGIKSMLLKLLGSIGIPALGYFLGDLLKGDAGHGYENEYGDLQHANLGDRVKTGSSRMMSKGIGGLISKSLGAGKGTASSIANVFNARNASNFYSNEADAYYDQGDITNAQEAQYGSFINNAKSKWYAVDAGARLSRSKVGSKFLSGVSRFATNRSIKQSLKGNVRSANIWGRIAGSSDNIAKTAKSYKGFTGRYNVIRSGFSNAGDTIMTWARNTVAKEGSDVASTALTHSDDISKIANGVNKFITKLFGEGKVAKLLNKVGAKISGVAKKITSWVSQKLAKQLVKASGTILGKIMGKVASIASVVLAWMPLATAVIAFINGWNNVNNELQLSDDYSPEWWERLTCALVYALDDFLCGAIDLFGLRDDLINLLIGFFGGEDKLKQIQESQLKASSEYEKFLQENDLSREAFTMEQYQNATNKTIWGHIKGFFGAGDNLDDYKKGTEKNEELKNKYGGYEAGNEAVESSSGDITNDYSNQEGGSSTTNSILLSILEAINGLAGGAYVVQNNQKTVNITGGSYDTSMSAANNVMSGGRGSYTNFRTMIPKSIFKNGGRNSIPQISKDALKKYNLYSGRGITVNRIKPTYGGRGTNGDQIVQTAMKYLGVPYVYGGTSPSGFDCSGLVQYVFKENGINISRTTYTQVKEGTQVDKSNLQPGDCVFFGTSGNVSHVGIYIGNDQYIHAPHTGDVVKISSLSDRSNYYTARRFVDPGNGSYSNTSSSNSNNSSISSSSNYQPSNSSSNLYSNSKSLLRSNARKPKITTISSNSTPEETILSVTSNKDMQNILHTAYENNENFMNDSEIANNKNIKKTNKTKEKTSESFASKVIKGISNVGSNIINTGKNILKKGANVAVNASQWAWDKIKKGANWITGKASGVWNWLTGGRGNNIDYGDGIIQDPDYYNQQDPRWGNMSFGRYDNHRDTVGDGGCGPTTAATVIQKMTGQIITPAEASKFALNNGYKVDDGGTTPDYFNALGSKYGINFNQNNPYSNETINSLQQGKPVIFLGHDMTGTSPFGSDSHYVVGTGMDRNGNISILDPKNKLNNRIYNINDIAYNSFESIIPNKTGGRGNKSLAKNKIRKLSKKQIFINDLNGDDTGLHQKMIKMGMIPGRNGRGKSRKHKYFKLLGGRGSSINIIEESYNWAGELSTRSQTNYIALHHAAAVNCTCQDIHNWHLANGWSGIGYHFVVYKDGSIHTGRPIDALGAHVSGMNNQSIGICAVGDYQTSDKTMPTAQYNSIVNLCKYLKEKYPNAKIVGHKEIGSSDCPGQYYPLEKIKNAVGSGGGVTLNNNSNSGSSNNGTTSVSTGSRLVGKLSGVLDALSPTNNILNTILNTAYSAYDGDSSSSSSSSGSASKNVGSRSVNYLGQQISYDQAADHPVTSYSKVTADQLKEAIRNYAGEGTWMETQVDNILQASNTYGVDPRWIISMAAGETGWHKEGYAASNSFFGIGAYDSNPDNTLNYANSTELDGWMNGVKWIKENYIDIGQDSLYRMKNPEAAGVDSYHSYQTGPIDTKVNIYKYLINSTGGAGSRGGRGSSTNKYLNNKLNKSNFKNPFNRKNKLNTARGSNNYKTYKPQHNASIKPIVSKYSTFNPIVKHKTNYGGRGITPIPTTSSVIDALSLKGTNSIVKTVDNAIGNSSSYNTNDTSPYSFDSGKLDEGNQISNAILTVLKGIAITLERIERNSAISGNNFNNISYSESGELTAQSYKGLMMNNIVTGN